MWTQQSSSDFFVKLDNDEELEGAAWAIRLSHCGVAKVTKS